MNNKYICLQQGILENMGSEADWYTILLAPPLGDLPDNIWL